MKQSQCVALGFVLGCGFWILTQLVGATATPARASDSEMQRAVLALEVSARAQQELVRATKERCR